MEVEKIYTRKRDLVQDAAMDKYEDESNEDININIGLDSWRRGLLRTSQGQWEEVGGCLW